MKKFLSVCSVVLFGLSAAAHADTITAFLTTPGSGSGLNCTTSVPCGTITITDNGSGGVTVTENLAPNFFVVTGNGTNHVSLAMDLEVTGLTAGNFVLPQYWDFGAFAANQGPAGFGDDFTYFVQFDDPNCSGSQCQNGHTEPTSVTFTINGVSTSNFDLTGSSDPFVSDINNNGNTGNVGGTGSLTRTPPVPEPSSLMLLGTGALGLAGIIRRRFKR